MRAARANAWYRQPILWVGAGVGVLAVGSSVWLILFAGDHVDPPLQIAEPRVMSVPVRSTSIHAE